MCEFVNKKCKICGIEIQNNKIIVVGTRFKRGDFFDRVTERAVKAEHKRKKAIEHFTMKFQGRKEEKIK